MVPVVALVAAALATTASAPPRSAVLAIDDGLARVPPMGWNSWPRFICDVNEKIVRETADALVASGMADLGYRYVVVDDCWQGARDAAGNIQADAVRFPSGIAATADYVHARGLRFGLYTDAGPLTCQRRPGSLGFEGRDARTYARWGVDYLKVDWCFTDGLDAETQLRTMRAALDAAGRPIVLSICTWGFQSPWVWGPDVGHLWRTSYDIQDMWHSVTDIVDASSRYADYAGPGHWNDPDMLAVGLDRLTDAEYRSQFSMWAIMAAPLIAGNDVRRMSPATLETLTNAEVIAVDQDPAGIQGQLVDEPSPGLQVWSRRLAEPGARAVALFNRTESPQDIRVTWPTLQLQDTAVRVRDLWRHADLGAFVGGFSARVPSHAVVLLRVGGDDAVQPARRSTWHVSGLDPLTARNGWGPMERDRSNGEAAAGDGGPLTLDAVPAVNGLGVHAPSDVRYALGGNCDRFIADVGVDGEVGARGSLEFEVWADGIKRYASGPMTGQARSRHVDVSLSGAAVLGLRVADAGDGNAYDHADWAHARVLCADGGPRPVPTPGSGTATHLFRLSLPSALRWR